MSGGRSLLEGLTLLEQRGYEGHATRGQVGAGHLRGVESHANGYAEAGCQGVHS